jgi:hypothetical protein
MKISGDKISLADSGFGATGFSADFNYFWGAGFNGRIRFSISALLSYIQTATPIFLYGNLGICDIDENYRLVGTKTFLFSVPVPEESILGSQ